MSFCKLGWTVQVGQSAVTALFKGSGCPAQRHICQQGNYLMRADRRSNLNTAIGRVLYFDAPKALIYSYVAALALSYVIVAVHTPLTIYPHAIHDDALYMSIGSYLSEGTWLGPYNEFTLAKGPGYPAFLALGNWLGVSASFAHALFHCAAIVFFVAVAHRFTQSLLISGLLLTLLLWHPITLSVYTLRVFREQIYYGQVLIIFAALAGALFGARTSQQRPIFAFIAGAALGWLWLSREEGLWILPGVAILGGVAGLYAYRERRIREIAGTLLIIVGVFVTTQVAFRSVNWWVYGKFVGVEDKETNFLRALDALQSVRSGGTRPFVSVTRDARQRIYAASPAFASLSTYFEGSPGEGWGKVTCAAQPASCGEIGAAWFLFALRSAAATTGHYSSPAEASSFYGRLADEVSAACASGTLECAPQRVVLMPQWTWQQLADGLTQRYLDALDLLLLLNPPLQFNGSTGTEASLNKSLRFLNYPMHTKSMDIPTELDVYTIQGWYYRSGKDWISAGIKAVDGVQPEFSMDRRSSPDIAAHFHDAEAVSQRFVIRTRCDNDCILELQTPEGEGVATKLGELRKGAFTLGKGTVFIDIIDAQGSGVNIRTAADRISGRIRIAAMTHYKFLSVPALVLGVIAFLVATMRFWKTALWNVCYVLALAAWLLVFLRASLLILISATSFPALNGTYISSAYFLLIAGAAFSGAAWLQLSGRGPSLGPVRPAIEQYAQ